MIRSPLRAVRISHVRRLLAALAFVAVTVKLSVLRADGGLDPLLEGRASSSVADLLAIHNLLRLPSSGLSSSQSESEYESPLRGGSAISLSSVVVRKPLNNTSGLEEATDFLGKDGAHDRSSLPRWIHDYLFWHDQQLKQINEDNWREFRYLVFRCRRQDAKCGGASDRIQPVPYGLLLANRTRRVLLIDWSRPCRLEEFLVPPNDGINWTVPSFVRFEYRANPIISMSRHSEFAYRDDMLVDVRHQTNDHGRSYYDAHRDDPANEPNFEEIYHRVWQLFFTPSPAVASILRETQRGYRLVPNQYVSVHIRAMYTGDRGSNADMVENAIHCATQLRPGYPIFLASDSRVASSYAIRYGRQIGAKVIAQVSDAPPLHIDRGQNFLTLEGADWMRRNATDFYDTFVDLYLLAGGSCTAFNIGGYGRWANLISSNSTCFINHHRHLCAYHFGNGTVSSSPLKRGALRPATGAEAAPRNSRRQGGPPAASENATASQSPKKLTKGMISTAQLSRRKKAPGWVEEVGGGTNTSPG